MTDEKIIEQLLAAFYNGNTTPEEENVLLTFFKNKDLKEKFQLDSQLFTLLYDSSRIPLPDGFSKRLEKAIDEHIANPRKTYIRFMSAAAVILLCIGLFFFLHKQPDTHFMADTYSNPEEAAVAVEQALMLVSTKLNQGLVPLEKVQECVNMTNRLLIENFYYTTN